ncbi:MAG: Lrp/AsnC family transcriptional regulator [Candidatus Woesearchaeota archaeon]|jgi:DNA-binding Lrp family transcriptional regulator|nr:Lrp/AsnC family transcriptional regulator [Candidatus Woesearchaeota archaeon]|tara:strand:- start:38 stop:466 length:429 start_codon:yes stop_codon:yes gene_type:complete
MQLDNRDKSIIATLKDNSRLSIRDIAKQTKIRPSTVHDRIVKLKKENIIEKFTLKLNNKAVEENFIVVMLIKTKPSKVFNQQLLDNKHVKEVFGITGEYDIMLKLKFKDVEEFNDFVLKFRKEENVITTMTMVATATIKEEF